MADTKDQYRVKKSDKGNYYVLEGSYNGGQSWHFVSSGSEEEMNKQRGYVEKGLTTQGLTQEEASKKAQEAPGPKFEDGSKSKSKTVVTPSEYAKMGGKTGSLPSLYELEHPVMYDLGNINKDNRRTDENGYIDNDGMVHLNSRATEARSKAAEEDRALGRDYKTAKAPSPYELELRIGKFERKNTDGTYKLSNNELLQARASARENNDTELEQKLQAEINRRYKAGEAPEFGAPKKDPLGGLTTEEWVKKMKDSGMSDDDIMKAYEDAGFSREGAKFKAAMSKYPAKSDDSSVETKQEAEDEIEKVNKGTGGGDKDPAGIREFSKGLNMFVLEAYNNGAFGDPKTWKAKRNAGFFILDKLATGLVNASLVARGISPSQKSAWSDVLDKQTELLGKDATMQWWSGLSKKEQEDALKTGVISGTTAKTIYETTDDTALDNTKKRDILEIKTLEQGQKAVAQQNMSALMARRDELSSMVANLSADMGWDDYAKAMNALVGTARGLSSIGVNNGFNTTSQKGFTDTLNVDAKTGGIPSMFVTGGVDNSSTWQNSNTENVSKSNQLSQDAVALSEYKDAKTWGKANANARRKANQQLIDNLNKQIEVLDKCIASWGKDLGVDTSR